MEASEWAALVEKYVQQLATVTQEALVGQVKLDAAERRILELEAAASAAGGQGQG